MVSEIIKKRAEELAEMLKGRTRGPEGVPDVNIPMGIDLNSPKVNKTGKTTKVQCRECMQENEVAPDQSKFTCFVCGTSQPVS